MTPENLPHVIHEALEQLGWGADANQVAERVQRLHIGLPAEDEFSILCGWLGKCRLIHKLDQQQYPVSSKELFQVPDLQAIFEYKSQNIPVLVEVKTNNGNTLSFRPDYYDKLLAYGEMLNQPILVAWKNKYGIWVLVDLRAFKKARKNYNLSFNDAMRENLLGILAGDFGYAPSEGAGIHLSAIKEYLISSEEIDGETVEKWHMRIDDVYFTRAKGERVEGLSPEAQNVFHSWILADSQTISDTHIVNHFVCDEPHMMFAHMALTKILDFNLPEGEDIHWRGHLGNATKIASLGDFRDGAQECLDKGIIHHIIDQIPQIIPDFLEFE